MNPVADLLFDLSRWILGRQRKQAGGVGQNALTRDAYAAWRESELKKQLDDNFPCESLKDRDVLDFGCGQGSLALRVRRLGAKSVTGIDLSEGAILHAREEARREGIDGVRFVVCHDPMRIALPDNSLDIVCCFDVLEHIMHPLRIAKELFRVLRLGGQVWVWWLPWRHPYGHHISSLIPLPWVHLFCSEQTLINVAARVYDDACYVPRVWNLDPETGEKLPNKWRRGADLSSWLNKLTAGEFIRICRRARLDCQLRPHGFGQRGIKRSMCWLAHIPVMGELFTSYYTGVLRKNI